MIDSVLKGTGNSRFLKSAVPAGTSWADALAMLQAGTFPIDFNGINTEGFQQVGTPLNKANLLKDATAAQIGLPPSTTPDGMFQALGNTGELHVWRKTVTTAQEIPAGYKLGDVKTKKDISATGSGEGYIGFYMGYSDNLAVDDNGGISLNPDNNYGEVTANSNFTYISSVIAGKFILIRSYQRPDDNSCSSLAGKIFYVPADANISMTREYNYLYIRLSKCQDVTGYPLTPAGTTTTYPVSTNPNAYQEGSGAKPAGYTLGDVETGKFVLGTGEGSSKQNLFYISSSVTVDDSGNISQENRGSTYVNGESGPSMQGNAANVIGKFIVLDSKASDSDFDVGTVWYIPPDATARNNYLTDGEAYDQYNIINYVTKRQPVTGYAAIPAGTIIEYMGKLGDKARVQVFSYVGTGIYGSEADPITLTFPFELKYARYIFNVEYAEIPLTSLKSDIYTKVYWGTTTSGEPVPTKISKDRKTLSWYANYSVDHASNSQGTEYRLLIVG